MARRRVADGAAALRGSLARDVRRGPLDLRGHRDRPVRAAQQEERPERAALRRRAGHHDPRGRRGAEGVQRCRADGGRARLRARRHAAAGRRREGRLRMVQGRERRYVVVSVPDDRQREPAARARLERADRALRPADDGGPLLRDDVPVGDAGRLVAVGRAYESRAAAGRHVSPVRQQDVDLGRRARPVGEHRPSRAREDSRGRRLAAGRRQGHLAVHRAEVPRARRRLARRAQRHRARGAEPQDGLSRHDELPAELRRGALPARRRSRRRRLSRRRAEPRPRADVPHDERGAHRRRPRRDRARLHRLSARARLRAQSPAGPAAGRQGSVAAAGADRRARRRASGCCSRRSRTSKARSR